MASESCFTNAFCFCMASLPSRRAAGGSSPLVESAQTTAPQGGTVTCLVAHCPFLLLCASVGGEAPAAVATAQQIDGRPDFFWCSKPRNRAEGVCPGVWRCSRAQSDVWGRHSAKRDAREADTAASRGDAREDQGQATAHSARSTQQRHCRQSQLIDLSRTATADRGELQSPAIPSCFLRL